MEDAELGGLFQALFWVLHWAMVATIVGAGPAIVATAIFRRRKPEDEHDLLTGYDASAVRARLIEVYRP